MGVRARGDGVYVWQGGQRVGSLYRYSLIEDGGSWVADARRYTIAPDFRPDTECEFLFFFKEGDNSVEFAGRGFIEDCVADGMVHRAPIYARGTNLELASRG